MEKKRKIIKTLIIFSCFVAIILAIYLPMKLTGLLDKINSADELKEVILNAGVYSYIVFFTIQFLQTVILPIPAMITTIAGTLVFGPYIACIISLVAVLSASILCFFLGRKIGKNLLIWVIGEKDTLKWQKTLEKGKYVFFLMMLFPIFPDDILCLVVGGITSISFKFFLITNLITRPIAIISTCFLGSGYLIPFSGWGIPVWIAIIILGIVLFYISIRYQSQIENFIGRLAEKMSRKKDEKNTNEFNKK